MKGSGIILALLFTVFLANPTFSGDTNQTMDHSSHVGEKIHEANVEGYHFAYHLVDLKKEPIRHLMVYIMGPDGKQVEEAKVGFLVNGPEGSNQKLMAEGMKGSFGANVDFKARGIYKIKMKVVTGGKNLFEEFTYEVR
ncbi:MAG: hypothetical protein ABII26_10630 [Pseudomonadota bacterium]